MESNLPSYNGNFQNSGPVVDKFHDPAKLKDGQEPFHDFFCHVMALNQ